MTDFSLTRRSGHPTFHRRHRPTRSTRVSMNRSRTNPRALIAQIFRTLKRQPDCLAAIDAGSRPVANHTHRNIAHHEVSGLAPGGLEETKYRHSMAGHLSPMSFR